MFSRAALAALLVGLAPIVAAAQSATPLLNTNTNSSSPTIPFGGFGDLGGPANITTAAAVNKAGDVFNMLQHGEGTPNDVDSYGRTTLMYAAINNNVLMAQVVLERNADVDLRDKLGNTALHWAADRGSVEVLKLLIGAKAAIDPQNRQGVTPLMMAVDKNRVEIVRLLLAGRADPKKQDYTGRDALGWSTNGAIAQLLKNPPTATR